MKIYRYGFKFPARNGNVKLQSMSVVHIVTSVLVDDSFFAQVFCFNNTNTSVRSFIFSPVNDSFIYIERAPM